MNESKITKILIILSASLFLVGGFCLWQRGWIGEGSIASIDLDIFKDDTGTEETISFWRLVPELAGFTEEKTYLVLFQNNLEIRPSGGYLGNFGIAKVKNGQLTALELHDTNIFDGFGTVQTDPPQPIEDYLNVTNWQMRDGNWSPDFPTAAQQVEEFYHLQNGTEEFDGIVAVNADILPDLLEFTGPVYLEEYDIEFKAEDALYQLEYEVEKGYVQRGFAAGDRKALFKALVEAVVNKLNGKHFWEQIGLKDLAIKELNKKNVMIYLKNSEYQKTIADLNWDGGVNASYAGNYLMLVEANLAGKKSNYFVDRNVEYMVDFTNSKPEVSLKIEYTHRGTAKDWFTEDYRCYLRIYVPKGSWLVSANGAEDETKFLDELNKTVFGNWIIVPVGQSKTIEFTYLLPESLTELSESTILVQKQSGIGEIPFKFTLVTTYQEVFKMEQTITADWEGLWNEAIPFR